MLDLKDFQGEEVLFIVAHPDDAAGLAGGLVSLLTSQGTTVRYLIATNGDKGGECYNSTRRFACPSESLAALRRQEQTDSARVLGVSSVDFLDLEDGRLASYDEETVRMRFTTVVRTRKPFAVFTFAPEADMDAPPMKAQCPACWDDLGYHPDHQMAGRRAMDTVVGPSAALDTMFPELARAGVPGWTVTRFYMFALTNPTHLVNIGGAPLDARIEAFRCHKSQYTSFDYLRNNTEWVARSVAKLARVPGVDYAEGYRAYF